MPPDARFVIEDEKQTPSSNPVYLFQHGLCADHAAVLAFVRAQSDGLFLPVRLDADASDRRQAAAGDGRDRRRALLQVGGTVGALSLCWWLQRHRFLAIAFLFVLAVPVVGSIGFAGLTSQTALLTATFFAGFIVLGIQIGINVVGAMIYPTSLRANGSGWQLGLGRIGSIVGPLLGALFVGMPVQQLYMWSALPFAAGAIVCFTIHRAQHGAAQGAPGTGEGAVTCMRHSGSCAAAARNS